MTNVIRLLQKEEKISVYHIMEKYGYSRDKVIDLIRLFFSKTQKYDGDIIINEASVVYDLGIMEYVGGTVNLANSNKLNGLSNLKHIGKRLNIINTGITNIGLLSYVGDKIIHVNRNFPISDDYINDTISCMTYRSNYF